MQLINVSQTQFAGWSSAYNFTAVHLYCLNSASENVWSTGNVYSPRAVYFDKHNLFSHCRRERKGDQRKRISVLSPLLSNVTNRKGEIISHPSGEKQQQGELNWEDNRLDLSVL